MTLMGRYFNWAVMMVEVDGLHLMLREQFLIVCCKVHTKQFIDP